MTKTEVMILDLAKNVAILGERLNSERAELERIDGERSKTSDQVFEMSRKVAVIEDKLNELKRTSEENDRRRWGVILAVIGCLLTLAMNLGLIYFKSIR